MSRPSLVVAELPGGAGRGQDRCRTADNLVIVLDGASAFDKRANPDASEYVDHLADSLLTFYVEKPSCELADGLALSIEATADTLGIAPGTGPSSTVAVIRWGSDSVDTLVLGDSTIVVHTATGSDRHTDDALAAIAPEVRSRYRDRLAAGGGFSPEHRNDLAELQRHQAARRNRDGGYWIAEAEPAAAHHAVTRSYPASEVSWCVAATDGVQSHIERLCCDWGEIVRLDANGAFDFLVDLHYWESHHDPLGLAFPRSKLHDDKTLAALRARP